MKIIVFNTKWFYFIGVTQCQIKKFTIKYKKGIFQSMYPGQLLIPPW